jgi:hypothetical protein
MVKAVINRTGGVTAKINSTTSSGPQQVSVTTPSSALCEWRVMTLLQPQ